MLSIFGGKITTARHLAEEALGKLAGPMGFTAHPVTRTRPFPGGEIGNFATFLGDVRRRWPFLGDPRAERMAHAYGSLLPELLDGVADGAGLGADLGGGLTELEARWLHDREWARSVDDVLLRRSKLGLHIAEAERASITAWWTSVYPS